MGVCTQARLSGFLHSSSAARIFTRCRGVKSAHPTEKLKIPQHVFMLLPGAVEVVFFHLPRLHQQGQKHKTGSCFKIFGRTVLRNVRYKCKHKAIKQLFQVSGNINAELMNADELVW